MSRSRIVYGATLFAAASLASNAYAATATGTLNVSITIAASCSVAASSALNFGTVSTIPANIDQQTSIVVNCSQGWPYKVGLGVGTGGGTTSARKLANGANTVDYVLYRDSTRTQIWGTSDSESLTGTGSSADQTLNVYGRVPTQTTPAPGTYSDAVTVTVTY